MAKKGERSVSARQVANIVACVLDATDEERAAGMLWYQSFGAAITAYGMARGVARERALAVFAALSPQRAISRNWGLYRHAIDYGSLDGMTGVVGLVRRKVDGLLAGTVSIEQATRGDKVSRFYTNLAGDPSVVTVDRHAVACATGGLGSAKGISHGAYLAYEAAYQVAARQWGIEPAQVQAIAWIVWRRQHGHKDRGALALLP